MKKITVLASVIVLVVLFSSGTEMSTGIVGYTGSPGENTCAACHSGGLNSNGGSINITASPTFVNNTYTPNSTYHITVTINGTGKSIFGFDFEALNNSNTTVGTIAVTDANKTQTSVTSNRNNIVHKKDGGASTNSASFTFDWTAPASGAVNFYASGVAGNGNQSDGGGDDVYTSSMQLSSDGTAIHTVSNICTKVFPNPVTDYFTLQMNLLSKENVTVALYSTEGKLVKKMFSDMIFTGAYSQTFSTEGISTGSYILKVSSESGAVNNIQKLVVQ